MYVQWPQSTKFSFLFSAPPFSLLRTPFFSSPHAASGHYLGTKACRYVAMATCLDTVTRLEVRAVEWCTGQTKTTRVWAWFSIYI